MPRHMPTPADFAEIAPGKSNTEIAAHYGCGITIITRFRAESGIPAPTTQAPKPVPDNFATLAPTMSYEEMEKLWGVGNVTITRWCRETGVKSIGRNNGRHRGKPRKASTRSTQPSRSVSRPLNRGLPLSPGAPSDTTDAGQAATFLRRLYPNVYRASILGKAERRARGVPGDGYDHFFVGGRGFLPANDMIELARAQGFSA